MKARRKVVTDLREAQARAAEAHKLKTGSATGSKSIPCGGTSGSVNPTPLKEMLKVSGLEPPCRARTRHSDLAAPAISTVPQLASPQKTGSKSTTVTARTTTTTTSTTATRTMPAAATTDSSTQIPAVYMEAKRGREDSSSGSKKPKKIKILRSSPIDRVSR